MTENNSVGSDTEQVGASLKRTRKKNALNQDIKEQERFKLGTPR
jgi:hypothetical protein